MQTLSCLTIPTLVKFRGSALQANKLQPFTQLRQHIVTYRWKLVRFHFLEIRDLTIAQTIFDHCRVIALDPFDESFIQLLRSQFEI